MHYKDGTEAKIGDLAYGNTHSGKDPVSGYVVSITPGAETCNAYIAVLRPLPNLHPSSGGTVLSVVNSGGIGNRFHCYVNSEIANCSDLMLLHRPESAV